MKLPTFKDLNFNVKKELWKQNPQTFKEWKERNGKRFSSCLWRFLYKTEQANSKTFIEMYKIIFYFGFYNYKKEKELFEHLKQRGFSVFLPTIKQDAIFGIDIIAVKNGIKYYIQVKPLKQIDNFKETKMLKLAGKGFVLLLAYKEQNWWKFINILSQQPFGVL
ncbi:hypothetical protein [[Mycoplasma] gypis]|uniref:hypothetical protein n=1 Tax=[Mycoplasma] gypis TaxID=92404 RepID=UPI001967097E|nr:hypothetical protein [[Mycoplasma] gypis]MBN0919688.1 hypothetical protein [[Mycoplasma] gypis]